MSNLVHMNEIDSLHQQMFFDDTYKYKIIVKLD